jgi:photosystem II stability/assembly factor-like uncharacterized protein
MIYAKEFTMFFKMLTSLLLLLALTTDSEKYTDTVYISVLSSQRHQWGRTDNPVIGIFRSSDAGMSWEHIGWRGYIRTFYTETGSDGVIWGGCGNGVLRSRDNGNSFTVTTGWDVTEVLKVRINPADPTRVVAATAYGIFRTDDGGETWTECNDGLPDLPFTSDVVIDFTNPNRLLAATEDGMFESVTGGSKWRKVALSGKGIRTIIQHPVNGSIWYTGTEDDGVFVSGDDGKTWKRMNNGLGHLTVYSIALDPDHQEVVYAGTHGGGVYKSINGGHSWEQHISGLQNLDVHALAVLPSNPSAVFAGTLNGGLYISQNGGRTWEFNSQAGGQVWGISVSNN